MRVSIPFACALIGLTGCSKDARDYATTSMFDESVYQELKSGLGVDLPKDYLDFLRSYQGVLPEPNSFWVVEGDWGSGIDELYTMDRGGNSQSILNSLNWDGLPLKPGLIPIGGDGCFGYILLSVRPEDHGSVHFCCTWSEDGKTDVFESQGFWKIADNFEEFIKNLGEMPEDDDPEDF